MKELMAKLEETRKRIDAFISEVVNIKEEPTELFKAAKHLIDAGGKRGRPYVALKACSLVGGEEEEAVPVAAALELLHTFTLIHDDIMDKGDFRRGVVSVHRQWDTSTAILAGDLLFAKVFETIVKFVDPKKVDEGRILKILQTVTEASISICKGQAYDMEFESRRAVSEEDYFKMIGGKTAALWEASAKAGAIAGGGSEREVKHLSRFGYYAGLAFQLVDDELGLVADEKVVGKSVGGDIREGKMTLIVIHALKNSSEDQKKRILKTLGDNSASQTQVREVIEIIRSLGSIDYVMGKAEDYINKAIESLEIFPDKEAKRDLVEFAEFIVERKF